MAQEFSRLNRISHELQKKISIIIQNDINDPRLKEFIITISSIELSRDLAYAKVFVTLLKNSESVVINNDDIINILQKSSQYIRFLLSKLIYLRVVPRLNFVYDVSLLEGMRISKIISIAKKN